MNTKTIIRNTIIFYSIIFAVTYGACSFANLSFNIVDWEGTTRNSFAAFAIGFNLFISIGLAIIFDIEDKHNIKEDE